MATTHHRDQRLRLSTNYLNSLPADLHKLVAEFHLGIALSALKLRITCPSLGRLNRDAVLHQLQTTIVPHILIDLAEDDSDDTIMYYGNHRRMSMYINLV